MRDSLPTTTVHVLWVSTQWPAVRTTFGAMSAAEQTTPPADVKSMLRYAASGYIVATWPPMMSWDMESMFSSSSELPAQPRKQTALTSAVAIRACLNKT